MNFEIFMGLIGIPGGIILTAIICYVTLAKKDKEETIEVKKEGGISQ